MFVFLLVFAVLSLIQAQCPDGYRFYGGTNKCFKFVTNPRVTWHNAQLACQQSGGNLASIENEEEDQYVSSIFADFDNAYFPFIGLTRPTPNATTPLDANWYWVDGSQSTYRKFSDDGYSFLNATVVLVEFDDVDWHALWNSPFLLSSYICSASPSFGNCTGRNPCETGWTYYAETGSCFKIFFNQTFDGGEAICQQHGGHLASLHDDMENYVVGSLGMTGIRQQETQQIWIGIKRQNNTWVSVDDGQQLDYYNFGSGFPDNFGGNENCVQMFADDWTQANGYQYTWNDLNCQLALRAFVCKVKAK